MGARTLHGSWDCFVFSFDVTSGNFFDSEFTLIFDISEMAYQLFFYIVSHLESHEEAKMRDIS